MNKNAEIVERKMYRAIPEVNRICSMAERGRQYRLHQEALARIRNRSLSANNARQYGLDKPKGVCPRQASILSKAQKDKQHRIYTENQRILKAIEYQSPTICLADFIEHEQEHERQVSRLTGHQEMYGFPISNSKKDKLKQKQKIQKMKALDPGVVRPIPKKFQMKDADQSNEAKITSGNPNTKSNSIKGSSKNDKSGKMDEIFNSGINGLTSEPAPASKNDENTKESNPPQTDGKLDDAVANIVDGVMGDDADNNEE